MSNNISFKDFYEIIYTEDEEENNFECPCDICDIEKDEAIEKINEWVEKFA